MTTDTELKLKLANKLQELISVSILPAKIEDGLLAGYRHEFFWLDTGKEVTEREWDWVVGKLESQLNSGTQWDLMANRKQPHATWQQRADALGKIGAI